MKKLLTILALTGAGLFTTLGATRSASVSNITITAHVDRFAEWAESNDVVIETDWSGPVNKVNQSRTTSKAIVLYTNTDTIISAKPGLNDGVLTNGSQTLNTAFKITGAVTSSDNSFKAAGFAPGQFFNAQNTYTVLHEWGNGAYTLTLVTQATSPSNSAPDAGLYTCGMVLTAEW